MAKLEPRSMALSLAAPGAAIVFSVTLTAVLLAVTGNNPIEAFSSMLEYAAAPRTQVVILNSAITYYFSAIAVAIGFRMNLFNIGVDGQYRLAALAAASVAGYLTMPPVLAQLVAIGAAVLVGAMWAGVAALLRAYRGVSEVISTIMLNFIATAIIGYLLTPGRLAESVAGSNNVQTPPIPEAARMPGLPLIPGTEAKVYGFLIVAILVGVGYWFLIDRTRFGFDLRATGMSEPAAVTSGVDVRRMIVRTMLLSGAVAGLVGLPQLMGDSYTYSLNFPLGLGFTGIAIALLGRNNPVGIAFGALLWSFLDQSAVILDLTGIAPEIVKIVQGVVVLSVVIAYEVLRRYRIRLVAAEVSRQLAARHQVEATA